MIDTEMMEKTVRLMVIFDRDVLEIDGTGIGNENLTVVFIEDG